MDHCSSQLELGSQLADRGGGICFGRILDPLEDVRGQFGWPSCRLLGPEVPVPGEGRCHPVMDGGGTQGVVAVQVTSHNVCCLVWPEGALQTAEPPWSGP